MDEELLKKALDNEKNEGILKLDTQKLSKEKNYILEQLNLTKKDLKVIQKKLKNYRFIEDIKELHYGSYIRWISLNTPDNIRLTNGGIVCDMKEVNSDIHIVCKNNMNRLFQLKMSENIIFQKVSDQEKILLHVMDYLRK